jgi:DNA-binding transcriptional LysR family regulator
MNLRHLCAFAAIADTGGFGRAAARLHLSQPALSRQIHALEEQLGMRLFDRAGRRVRLTSEGEDLLRRGRRLLAEAESLGERARALKEGNAGILRVGATPQVIEKLLAPFLAVYRRSCPNVEVHLVEDGGARLPQRLERGDVNLALSSAVDARFRFQALYPMHVLAVMLASHRFARRSSLEVEALGDEPLLLLRREFGSREWFDLACQTAHVRPLVLLESAAPQALIALAENAYGTAIIPSNVGVPSGILRAVPLVQRGMSVGRWQTVCWDPRRFLAPYAERFVEDITAYCVRRYPGRDLIRRAPTLPGPKPRLRQNDRSPGKSS